MLTFHPCGFTHGPHPKAMEAGARGEKTFTDEVAIMVDTRQAMEFQSSISAVELSEYVYSWKSADH